MNIHLLCKYEQAKRDEMTFGYLASEVPADLVPDMTGSARFYSEEEVALKMTEMDRIFVGMRRSTIDKTEMIRQNILYTIISKIDENNQLRIAVYQRAAGAEAKLKDGYSFGFGGHVETQDLRLHAYPLEDSTSMMAGTAVSSFISTLASGYREVEEEVRVTVGEPVTRPLTPKEIGDKFMAHFGFQEVRTVSGEVAFDEVKENAIFTHEKFLVTVDENQPKVGCLVMKENVTMAELHVAVFNEEPTVTEKTVFEPDLSAVGFLSDAKTDQPGFIGNTHICVIGLGVVPSVSEFQVTDEKYTTIGWLTREEILELKDKFEPWSNILTGHLAEIEELTRLKS